MILIPTSQGCCEAHIRDDMHEGSGPGTGVWCKRKGPEEHVLGSILIKDFIILFSRNSGNSVFIPSLSNGLRVKKHFFNLLLSDVLNF